MIHHYGEDLYIAVKRDLIFVYELIRFTIYSLLHDDVDDVTNQTNTIL